MFDLGIFKLESLLVECLCRAPLIIVVIVYDQ